MAARPPILRSGWKLEPSTSAEKRFVNNDKKTLRTLIQRRARKYAHPPLSIFRSANQVAVKLFLDRVKIPHDQLMTPTHVRIQLKKLNEITNRENTVSTKLKKIKKISVRNFVHLLMEEYVRKMGKGNAWMANRILFNIVFEVVAHASPLDRNAQQQFFNRYLIDMSALLPEELT
ncbi:MAG: hypothetical protein AABX02_00805 [archaeon]